MGEQVYMNPHNIFSILLSFEMPESATVFNQLREKLDSKSFNNVESSSLNTNMLFSTKNPPYPHGINQWRIFKGTSYTFKVECYEIDKDKIDEKDHIRVRPSLIYFNRGEVPDELMEYVIKGRLAVRDGGIITKLLSGGLEGIELKGVGKIKVVDDNELNRETERVSLEYRFRNDKLRGVDAYIAHGDKKCVNMEQYNQMFRVLFPNYDGILSPEALAGWKGLEQDFENGEIFLLDKEVSQKKAIDEIVDVLGTKLWKEFELAVALVESKVE
jgi:hypothetical protein